MCSESLARAPAPAAAAPGGEPLRASSVRLRSAVEIGWIVVLFFLLGGGPAPAVNEPHYLSRAKHFWDPDFCRGDFFLESRDAHPVFFALFGWITRWLSLPVSAWVGRFFGWLLLAASWHRLSSAFVPRAGYSLLSAALCMTLIQRGHMSGEWLIGGIEAKVIAYSCVFWGLSAWVRGQMNAAWILFGAATALHVLVGGWTLVIALASSAIAGPGERRRLARSLPGVFTAGVISLAGLLPAWQLNADLPEAWVTRAEEIYVFDRIRHHLLIRDFKPIYVVRHLLLIGLLGVVYAALPDDRRFRRLAQLAWGAVGLALIGALLDVALGESRWTARLLRYYWFRATDVFVPLALSIAAIVLLERSSAARPRWAAAGLAIALIFVGGSLVSTVAQLHRRPLPAADVQGGIQSPRQWMAWRDACEWAETNIPAATCFLTPSDHQTFKWYAQRPEVVTWKDVPQDAESVIEWSRRLTRVRRWEQSTTQEESNARFAELRDAYGFHYALIRWPAPFPLPSWPIVYRNSDYVILYVGGRDAG